MHIETCELNKIHLDGAQALCRVLCVGPTYADDRLAFDYRAMASAFWEHIQPMIMPQVNEVLGCVAGQLMSLHRSHRRHGTPWVHALPLLDEWPFWHALTQYPTAALEKVHLFKVKKGKSMHRPTYPWPHHPELPTTQACFVEALLETAEAMARCLRLACQGLQDQRHDAITADGLVAAYTIGHYSANAMRVPMQTLMTF